MAATCNEQMNLLHFASLRIFN